MENGSRHKELIRQKALDLGFSFVGISKAERLDEEARRLEQWLHLGYHGKMQYMEHHFDMRVDPRQLVPGARSVISLMFNYFNDKKPTDPEAPRLSNYAYGQDYHLVLKKKLKDLLQYIREEIGAVEGRCFVDSAPVMEREWAKRSGLGWAGKNTLIIHPKAGSFFFLAVLVTDLELAPDQAIKDHCGTCTRCIDACPTDAIAADGYLLDASRCISYLTIELREEIQPTFRGQMENYMFGCDICQEVCPWNRFSKPHSEPAFEPHPDLLKMTKQDWEELTEEVFQKVFKKSAVKRAKYIGLKRNIAFLKKS